MADEEFMPLTPLGTDLGILLMILQPQGKPFTHGACARIREIPDHGPSPAWSSGWAWADRIVRGLEHLYSS